jgi:3-oxoacyl-[acyl-carrier-protein] synthase II
MDRLSEWALVGSVLALQDAAIDAATLDRDRTAVVCGTAFGCLERTEEFLAAVARNAAFADPIVFPETLSNQPGSHVARQFGLRGPNLTIDAGYVSGEVALVQAVSLLQSGQADRVLVVAGDLLTQRLYEWYDAAWLLEPGCFEDRRHASRAGRPTIVPSEGLAACVLETSELAEARHGRVYGRYHSGWLGSFQESTDGTSELDATALLRRMRTGEEPREVEVMVSPNREFGAFGGSGLLQVGLALARLRDTTRGYVMVAGSARHRRQAATVLLAREGRG